MLPEFGVPTTAGTRTASVTGPAAMLRPAEVARAGRPLLGRVRGCAAALLKPGSSVMIEDV